MFIDNPSPWYRKFWLSFLKSPLLEVANLLGILGLVITLIFAPKDVAPWHLSFVIIFMAILYTYFCSRYHAVKNSQLKPKKGYSALHKFAEAMRENAIQDYSGYLKSAAEGKLDEKTLKQLISKHSKLAHIACQQAKDLLNNNGGKIDRVCVKLTIGSELRTIADDKKYYVCDGGCSPVANSIFWRLLWCVHESYEDWKSIDPVTRFPGNKDLKEKPRFLAISGLDHSTPPASFLKIAESLEHRDKVSQPMDHKTQAESLWGNLRNCVKNRYKNCVGMVISGPQDISDPLFERPESESTRHSIGFVGMDSTNSFAVRLMEQADLEGIAAIADLLYFPMSNLKTFFESLKSLEKL